MCCEWVLAVMGVRYIAFQVLIGIIRILNRCRCVEINPQLSILLA